MGGYAPNTQHARIAHLLRRAGFGASHAQIEAYARKGLDVTIKELVYPEQTLGTDVFERTQDRLQRDFLDYRNFGDIQLWWLNKMAHTDRPLIEKMTLFWHGHFATAYSKVRSPERMISQNMLFRKHALGNFKTLTLAVSQDPAMIVYLDNNTNRKGKPNENYARELFELFTLGIGNYTEKDIQEAARAFTGWTANPRIGRFVFNPREHDEGEKTVFGKTGNWNGENIVDMAVTRRESAEFLCTKLFRFFVHDDPKPADIKPFADLWQQSNYELKPVLEAMFRSPVFYSDKALWAKIKSPAEFVVGAMRSTQAQIPLRFAPLAMRQMGQELFNPPNVKGWDGGEDWVNSSALMTRFNFAMQLARVNASNQPLLQTIQEGVEQQKLQSAEDVVDFFAERILQRPLSPETRRTLVNYMNTGPDGQPQPFTLRPDRRTARTTLLKIQGLMHMTMLTPEYQLA